MKSNKQKKSPKVYMAYLQQRYDSRHRVKPWKRKVKTFISKIRGW